MTPGRLKIWNEAAGEWQYLNGGSQPVQVVGPFTFDHVTVAAAWSTDYADLLFGYTIPAGKFVYDVTWDLPTAFTDGSMSFYYPAALYVGSVGSEEWLTGNPNHGAGNDACVLGWDFQNAANGGTYFATSPAGASPGLSRSALTGGLYAANDSYMRVPTLVLVDAALRLRIGDKDGGLAGSPTAGEASFYLWLATPAVS